LSQEELNALRLKKKVYLALKAQVEREAYSQGFVEEELREAFKAAKEAFMESYDNFCKCCDEPQQHSEFDSIARTLLVCSKSLTSRPEIDEIP